MTAAKQRFLLHPLFMRKRILILGLNSWVEFAVTVVKPNLFLESSISDWITCLWREREREKLSLLSSKTTMTRSRRKENLNLSCVSYDSALFWKESVILKDIMLTSSHVLYCMTTSFEVLKLEFLQKNPPRIWLVKKMKRLDSGWLRVSSPIKMNESASTRKSLSRKQVLQTSLQ